MSHSLQLGDVAWWPALPCMGEAKDATLCTAYTKHYACDSPAQYPKVNTNKSSLMNSPRPHAALTQFY